MDYGPLPPRDHLLSLLEYQSDTGLLIWRYRPAKRATLNTRFAGKVAGHYSPERRYCTVRIDGKLYQAHRVIWLMVTGALDPAVQVDHRDLDRGNNRWGNLRLAHTSQNAANTRARANNKCGLKGASLHRQSGLWHAQITVNRRRLSLGYFKTAEGAHQAYAAAAAEHFGEFARAA